MPANTSITTDSSTAPIELPPITVTAPPPSGTSNNPSDVIQPIAGATSGNLLVYPSDCPKYYMKFDIYEYRRHDLLQIGHLGPVISTIVLPCSATLNDLNAVDWRDAEIRLGGFAFNQAADALRGINIASIRDIGDLSARIGAAAGLGVAGEAMNAAQATANALMGGALNAASAILGYSSNQFVTMMFVGPKFKRHGFVWQMAPDSKAEADTLRRMANTFKNTLSPALAVGGLLWKFPRIVWPSFHPNSRFMYKFKPCAIEEFTVNYAPKGRFHNDPHPELGENAPAHIDFALKLVELENWQRGNFGNNGDSTNDPFDVYHKED
jgi:hypothetical protein